MRLRPATSPRQAPPPSDGMEPSFPSAEFLSVLRDRTCDHLQAENERLRAEKKALRVRNKFLRDYGRVSIRVAGPGGAPTYATGTLSQRDCLEDEERGDPYVAVMMREAEGAACTLGSLLDARLVLKNAEGTDRSDVANPHEGRMVAMGGDLLRIVFMQGNEEDVFHSLSLNVLASQLSNDVPVPEVGDAAEWYDGPPEWLAANRGAPVELECVMLSLPRLFRMYAGDDEGGNGTD